MGRHVLLWVFLTFVSLTIHAQTITQTLKGVVSDKETGRPLAGANIVILNTDPPSGTSTDAEGKFRLNTEIGRISVKVTFLGYEDLFINDMLIASGKEIYIPVELQEKVIQTGVVVVRPGDTGKSSLNPMATASATTIRTKDAMRYAGGFYDPSRIVNAFAGISNANNDYSNDIVIRGNSSRGLLWRLEGIEIPNPNHFSDGQGGSGGAFSAITSNVIDNFDFFTGAFPAEYGNAFSGVMDLKLRKGNSDKREYAFQTGMIGAEISMEGPFSKSSDASYLLNARYTSFKFLADLKIIDLEETNVAPSTRDMVFNINLPLRNSGTINFFGLLASNRIGKTVVRDTLSWKTLSDRWEEMGLQSSVTFGAKYLYTMPDEKTYLKSVIAYSTFTDLWYEGYVDSSYIRTNSYSSHYRYPSLRYSILANHKLNQRNVFRSGVNLNFLSGTMSDYRLNSTGGYDTLLDPSVRGNLYQGYFQWKYRSASNFEFIAGLHLMRFSLNDQSSLEPRIGIRWQMAPGNVFLAGFGLHSRTESLAVYNALIRDKKGVRSLLNNDLELSKSLHWVAGLDLMMTEDLRFRIEGYIQYLFNIPIVNKITSQYSTINAAERLTDAVLENAGTGMNNGVEVTFEKTFSRNYYFLITGSIMNSWYTAGDKRRYNTYYNTRYISNIIAGKDFPVGRNKRNSIGINSRFMLRGGYRYTPVNEYQSLKSKRIIYDNYQSYKNQLPDFIRFDAGINFRKNQPEYSWIIMLDIQNVTGRRNIFRRRFSFENGHIISNDILSLGMIPVFNFRVEF
jgi:hypothetical protein